MLKQWSPRSWINKLSWHWGRGRRHRQPARTKRDENSEKQIQERQQQGTLKSSRDSSTSTAFKMLISVDGNISSGKSSLVAKIVEHFSGGGHIQSNGITVTNGTCMKFTTGSPVKSSANGIADI